MAKGEEKQNYQNAQSNAREQTGSVQSGYNQFTTDIGARMPTDRAAADEERSYLTSGYRNLVDGTANRDYLRSITGGPPYLEGNHPGGPGAGSSSGGGGGGGGGTPSDPYGSVRGGFNEFANTGGVDYGAMTESLGGFRNLASTGGFSDENLANLRNISRGYDDIAARPFDRTDVDASIRDLRGFSSSGGYDPSRLGQIYNDVDNLRNFESIDQPRLGQLRDQQNRLVNLDTSEARGDRDRMRLLDPQFQDWADTGGYTEADKTNIRNRATSTIPSLYSGVRDEIARRNAMSGGYSPGYSASVRAISRDSARGTAEAAREAELGISDRVRSGRQYGLTGLATNRAATTDASTNILNQERQGLEAGTRLGQDLDLALAGNRLRGLESGVEASSRLEADMANNRIRGAESSGNLSLNAGTAEADRRLSALAGRRDTELEPIKIGNETRLGALRGITDTSQGAQRTVQSGRQFGLGGLMGIAQAEEASRQAAASRAASASAQSQAMDFQRMQLASQNERFSQEMGLNALGGLGDLYRSAPGQVGMYNDDYLGGLAGWNDSIGTGVATQQPYNSGQQSWWKGALNTGLNALPGLFGGGSNKPGGGPPAGYGGGATDEYGRPIEPAYNDNYFGSPTYPNVSTDEVYGYPGEGGNIPGGDPSIPVPSWPGIHNSGAAAEEFRRMYGTA